MTNRKDGGAAFPKSCNWCADIPVRKQGRIFLCEKHYRHQQMRTNAKRKGKAVPSYVELEELTDKKLECLDCGIKMNWLAKDGQCTVATLQHYRDGTLGIVCRSCNTRHAFMKDDDFRFVPKNHKFCPQCKEVKHFDSYSKDNGRTGNIKLKSWCKACSNKSYKIWAADAMLAEREKAGSE